MKGYLFGLGTMLVGAGLMFVLMHGEVSAEGEKVHCDDLLIEGTGFHLRYCKIRDLTCVSRLPRALSCVKS